MLHTWFNRQCVLLVNDLFCCRRKELQIIQFNSIISDENKSKLNKNTIISRAKQCYCQHREGYLWGAALFALLASFISYNNYY